MKKRIIGVVLVGVGLIGCLFPIAPGIPVVIVGVALIFGFTPKNNKLYKKYFENRGKDGPVTEIEGE